MLTKTVEYDARRYLSDAYPSWWITCADLGPDRPDHVICMEAKLIIVDPSKFDGDEALAKAHIGFHLDEHMHKLQYLTDDDCDQADFVAALRLDREGSRNLGE